VPFGHTISAWLHFNHLPLEQLVRHDRIEEHYLAWETVRKQTNPFFYEGTGFEGYLVGRCPHAIAALDLLLASCQEILDDLTRLHRFEYTGRNRLMKTLVRESDDLIAIQTWSTYLGAELARLRARILNNQAAQNFQHETYELVHTLPPMVYHETNDDVNQDYAIGWASEHKEERLHISLQILSPKFQDAWLVAQNIGEFGHPLIRRFLERV
jgi:hypothetical protein